MSTDTKDKLKTNSQKRENIKLNLILIIYLTLIQSRLCHCCLKYPTPTRHCQKWKITNYSLLINKNGTSAQAFILLLFSIVSTKRSVGEFTNSLLHSWPCCATWESCCSLGQKFHISPPRRTNLLPLTQREICLTDCYFKDIFYESKQT